MYVLYIPYHAITITITITITIPLHCITLYYIILYYITVHIYIYNYYYHYYQYYYYYYYNIYLYLIILIQYICCYIYICYYIILYIYIYIVETSQLYAYHGSEILVMMQRPAVPFPRTCPHRGRPRGQQRMQSFIQVTSTQSLAQHWSWHRATGETSQTFFASPDFGGGILVFPKDSWKWWKWW